MMMGGLLNLNLRLNVVKMIMFTSLLMIRMMKLVWRMLCFIILKVMALTNNCSFYLRLTKEKASTGIKLV